MNNKSKYSVLTYLFLLLTIFVLFIFTKNVYYKIKENSSMVSTFKETLAQKQKEYDDLSKIKIDIDSWKSGIEWLEKFLINFSEDELTKYFYDYANTNNSKLRINSIWLTEWKLNEYGFKEGNIDLSVTFATEQDMIDMLNFLLNSDKYNFYIHNFEYPFGKIQWNFTVSIPLKVLYK